MWMICQDFQNLFSMKKKKKKKKLEVSAAIVVGALSLKG